MTQRRIICETVSVLGGDQVREEASGEILRGDSETVTEYREVARHQ